MAENKKDEILEEDFEERIIVLYDEEEDKDIKCEWLDEVEYEGRHYAVVLPIDNEDGTVMIMEMIPDDDSDDDETWLFAGIEDQELLAKIYELFKEANAEDFDFE